MRKRVLAAGAALAAAAALAGCGASHTSTLPQPPPSAVAHAKGLASVPGFDAKTVLINAGVPVNGTSAQQIAFMEAMFSLKHPVQAKANRKALMERLAIPAGPKRTAFEDGLLTAAKHDHVLTSAAGRRQLLDKDLPNLYAQEA